jgi:hypothetical protein
LCCDGGGGGGGDDDDDDDAYASKHVGVKQGGKYVNIKYFANVG